MIPKALVWSLLQTHQDSKWENFKVRVRDPWRIQQSGLVNYSDLLSQVWTSSGRWWGTDAWNAAVHGVAKSWTQPGEWTTTNDLLPQDLRTSNTLKEPERNCIQGHILLAVGLPTHAGRAVTRTFHLEKHPSQTLGPWVWTPSAARLWRKGNEYVIRLYLQCGADESRSLLNGGGRLSGHHSDPSCILTFNGSQFLRGKNKSAILIIKSC